MPLVNYHRLNPSSSNPAIVGNPSRVFAMAAQPRVVAASPLIANIHRIAGTEPSLLNLTAISL